MILDCVGYLWELGIIVIWGSEDGWMGVDGFGWMGVEEENTIPFTLHFRLYMLLG